MVVNGRFVWVASFVYRVARFVAPTRRDFQAEKMLPTYPMLPSVGYLCISLFLLFEAESVNFPVPSTDVNLAADNYGFVEMREAGD